MEIEKTDADRKRKNLVESSESLRSTENFVAKKPPAFTPPSFIDIDTQTDEDEDEGDEGDEEEIVQEYIEDSKLTTIDVMKPKVCCGCVKFVRGGENLRLRTAKQELVDCFIFRAVPLHPEGNFLFYWSFVILVSVLYTIIYVPISVAWPSPPLSLPWIIFDLSVDFIFLVDLVFGFLTSFLNSEEEWEMLFKKTSWHYFRGWFMLDLIASFPYDIVLLSLEVACESEGTCDQSQLNLLQLLKLVRLLRVTKLIKFVASRSLSVTSSLVVLVLFFICLAHWFGCIWWTIAVIETLELSWVVKQSSIADLNLEPMQVQYSTSIYWAFVTMATLGYGDVTAFSHAEQIYVTLVIFTGAMVYAVLVGSVQQIVTWRFSSGAEYNHWMDRVNAFCTQNHLNKPLRSKLIGYYNYVWDRRRTFEGTGGFMDDMPFELKIDVADCIHAKLFRANPVFEHSQLNFKHFLATKLGPGLIKLPDEVLFFEGDIVQHIVLVRNGLLELVVTQQDSLEQEELIVSSREDGQYCGDIGLFSSGEKVHFVSCVVADFSDIHLISSQDLLQILETFPEEQKLFQRVAEKRRNHISKLLELFKTYIKAWGEPLSSESRQLAAMFLSEAVVPTVGVPLAFLTQKQLEKDLWSIWEEAITPAKDNALCEEALFDENEEEDENIEALKEESPRIEGDEKLVQPFAVRKRRGALSSDREDSAGPSASRRRRSALNLTTPSQMQEEPSSRRRRGALQKTFSDQQLEAPSVTNKSVPSSNNLVSLIDSLNIQLCGLEESILHSRVKEEEDVLMPVTTNVFLGDI